jgi:flavodoxin
MKKETNDANYAGTRVLIVYHSHSGNTRKLANRIHKRVGGDIVEIQPVDSYRDDYETVTKQAKRELQSGYKPVLKTRIENIGSYDIIFLGSPNWWDTSAPPVITFLTM